jgi:hypothetical protein
MMLEKEATPPSHPFTSKEEISPFQQQFPLSQSTLETMEIV